MVSLWMLEVYGDTMAQKGGLFFCGVSSVAKSKEWRDIFQTLSTPHNMILFSRKWFFTGDGLRVQTKQSLGESFVKHNDFTRSCNGTSRLGGGGGGNEVIHEWRRVFHSW